MTAALDPLLQLNDLKVHFRGRRRAFWKPRPTIHAVDGVSLTVRRGTTFGIVGESGSGKTTAALAILRLVRVTHGSILFDGVDLTALAGEELRRFRRRLQIVFQDPYSSLDPRRRAGDIIREPLDLMEIGGPAERQDRVAQLLESVGLSPAQGRLLPHQFSGGQRQRVGIARALATNPELVVCDEPVSALDVAVQAQTLNLLVRLQRDLGLTYVFISHDLGVVRHVCDEVAIMYLGRVVEHGLAAQVFRRPLHPYTWALLSAIPGRGRSSRRIRLDGDPPSPIDLPPGCRFAGRCPFAIDECHRSEPPLRRLADGQAVACHRVSADGSAPQNDSEAVEKLMASPRSSSEPPRSR
jgi:peptide/nickel transport system ATP-binding protein